MHQQFCEMTLAHDTLHVHDIFITWVWVRTTSIRGPIGRFKCIGLRLSIVACVHLYLLMYVHVHTHAF